MLVRTLVSTLVSTIVLTSVLLLVVSCSDAPPPNTAADAQADTVDDAPDQSVDALDTGDTADQGDQPDSPSRAPFPQEISADELTLDLPTSAPIDLPSGVTIRAATYNVFGANRATAEDFAAWFDTFEVDIIGLQECPAALLADIEAASDRFNYAAGDGVAIVSRTALRNFESLDIEPGSREVVRADTTIDGVEFTFYSAHLSWDSTGDLQCRDFVDRFLSLEDNPHTVLVGDFNDEHGSSQIRILEEVMVGAFERLGWFPGEHISWPASEFEGGEGSQHIDLAFYRDTSDGFFPIVVSGDVVNQRVILSDHKPVWVELLFPASMDAVFDEDPYEEQRDVWYQFPTNEDDNLLTNPGAEDGLDGWEIVGDARAVTERRNQAPRTGTQMFTGTPESESSHRSSGAQTVDLSAFATQIDAGQGLLLASAWMATGYLEDVDGDVFSNQPEPYDDGEIIIEALAADGTVLRSLASQRHDTLEFRAWTGRLTVPPATRSVRYTWYAHRKRSSGPSSDAVFDDLSLSFFVAVPLLEPAGPNLLRNPGAELGNVDGWLADGWQALPDLDPYGGTVWPPWSYSGAAYFMAGGRLYIEGGQPGLSTLSQVADLSDYATDIDDGNLALHWGGHVRTWAANTDIQIELEFVGSDAESRFTYELPSIWDAEWSEFEALTAIPPGTASVDLRFASDVEQLLTGAYLDEVFLIPIRIGSTTDD